MICWIERAEKGAIIKQGQFALFVDEILRVWKGIPIWQRTPTINHQQLPTETS